MEEAITFIYKDIGCLGILIRNKVPTYNRKINCEMSCQVEQIADCGDILSLGRALFVPEKEGIVKYLHFS